jgi:polyferredoxin
MPKHLTPHRVRRLVQSGFALASLWIGWRFAAFLAFTSGAGPEAARPASVEAFLPISALMAAKRLVLTGRWDAAHPAGLALLLCFLFMTWALRKGFCGNVCPVGLLSNLLAELGGRAGLGRTLPRRVAAVLLAPKYLLLGFFLYNILSMPLAGLEGFLRSPYNLTADARMFLFFRHPGPVALCVLGALAALSIVVRNPWCRFLCPYGALLGLCSLASPTAVTRDEDACIGCGRCSRACPSGIAVQQKRVVASPECVGCAECVGACPVEGCLAAHAGPFRLPPWGLALGCVALVAGCFLLASALGAWESPLPADMLARLYAKVLP